MECVVEHGGFDGELSHKVLFGILGDTQPVELFTVGGAVGMGGDGSPVVAYAHGTASVEVDDDPRAAYFKQAQYGMFGRMALILLLLQDEDFVIPSRGVEISSHRCDNPKCVTQSEAYLPNLSYRKLGMQMCGFCDQRID